MQLEIDSKNKDTNVLSIRSPVVLEERMRSGHWFGLACCVSFSALTSNLGWHLDSKTPVPLIPKCSPLEQLEEGPTRNPRPPGKRVLKWRWVKWWGVHLLVTDRSDKWPHCDVVDVFIAARLIKHSIKLHHVLHTQSQSTVHCVTLSFSKSKL